MFCTNCGKEISGGQYCEHCGAPNAISNEKMQSRPTAAPAYKPMKNPGVAALLAALPGFFGIAGLGHIYVEQLGKGIAILIGYLFIGSIMMADFLATGGGPVTLLLIFPSIAIFIWQIYDAHKAAVAFNGR